MAKTTNCPFCGKEITTGFFNGSGTTLDIGPSLPSIPCCMECYDILKFDVKRIKKRLEIKLDNLQKTRKKKLTAAEMSELLVQYLEEEDAQLKKTGDVVFTYVKSFFSCNDEGFFSVKEYGKGDENKDITVRRMIKSMEKAQEDTQCLAFDKNDITKIEYAKADIGTFIGLFRKAYPFAIRLNDETVVTYKPCVTRAYTLGYGFMFGYQRSAEKKLVKILEEFRKIIGSDLPITKVKKI